jgi:hypothetical protein
MKVLLKTGADPSEAIQYAVAYEDEDCLQILLDSDCQLFESPAWAKPFDNAPRRAFWRWGWDEYTEDIIGFRLKPSMKWRETNPNILLLLINAIAKYRRQLMELAKVHITVSQLEELGWKDPYDSHVLVDSAAGPVAAHLLARGVLVPRHLWPGSTPSVYLYPGITAEAANMLHNTGFLDVDAVIVDGLTPLQYHWKKLSALP